ncbi:hypothetical protein GOBAR_DD16797 [Gossypium barbadense]|nr:hypothetical protein GOBAR_DD16797 [Gossypium barbadense]
MLKYTSVDTQPTPRRVSSLKSRIFAVAAADKHTVVVSESGEVFTWGCNSGFSSLKSLTLYANHLQGSLDIEAQLLYLDVVDPQKDIVMYVNSPGGSVTAGMAIFDVMRHIRPDVSTVCVGLAASMGAFLLSAGTKGKWYSLPNSRVMIHQPLCGAEGGQTDIDIQLCKENGACQ